MDYLILGSTGLLGQKLIETGKKKKLKIIGISRKSKEYNFNFLKLNELRKILKTIKPKYILNAVGVIDIDFCEKNIERAYKINSYPLKTISNFCNENKTKLIHISTDHYFVNNKKKKHNEKNKILLVNNYAKSKYLAEKIVKKTKDYIIIRTNFTGFKKNSKKKTFIEWLVSNHNNNKKIKLFNDYYCSTIDVYSLSNFIFKLIEKKFIGIINLASSTVSSKKEFAEKFFEKAGFNKNLIHSASVNNLKTRRANSLGLDVKKAEKILNCKMPKIDQVCLNLLKKNYEQ